MKHYYKSHIWGMHPRSKVEALLGRLWGKTHFPRLQGGKAPRINNGVWVDIHRLPELLEAESQIRF